MTMETKQLGILGEDTAVKYLKEHGYKILDRNFRYKGYGELDIVAKKSEDLAFIEVKTRFKSNTDSNYAPEDNITYFKQKQLIKLAKIYLAKNKIPIDTSWQIDIIAIEIPQESAFDRRRRSAFDQRIKIRHIEQAIQDIY